MNRTNIDYCDLTWNLWTGCLHGCPYCYAKRIAERFRARNGAEHVWGIRTMQTAHAPGGNHTVYWAKRESPPFPMGWAPTYYPLREHEPLELRKPKRIFVGSMADVFGDWVPSEWLARLFALMAACPEQTFLLLTKDPESAEVVLENEDWQEAVEADAGEFSHGYEGDWPLPNVHLGATVESNREWERAANLVQARAAVHWLSLEPLLGRVDRVPLKHIEWVAVGAQTGPGARKPDVVWLAELRERCERAGIPLWMKSNLQSVWGADLVQQLPKGGQG